MECFLLHSFGSSSSHASKLSPLQPRPTPLDSYRGRFPRAFSVPPSPYLFTNSVKLPFNNASHDAHLRSKVTRLTERKPKPTIVCQARNGQKPLEPSTEAKMRNEVIYPFRTLRMALYLVFIASAGIGALISLTKVIAELSRGSIIDGVLSDTISGFAIDIGAVSLFAFLYSRDVKAKNSTLARLSREENLSALRVELSNKRILTLKDLRGSCRVIIISGSKEYIDQAFQQAEAYKSALIERGVLVVPFCTDGSAYSDASAVDQKGFDDLTKSQDAEKRWKAFPLYTNEWNKWFDEQRKEAKVEDGKPVYISLRIDGRVRASGIGCPPWKIISAQLPPMKGIWAGALDGMDGRV